MTAVFDFEDFIKARLAEDSGPHVAAVRAVLALHQPILTTWHPVWFCGCCEGSDEPEHHMGHFSMTMEADGTTSSEGDPGPLMKAGADWPCETLLALAGIYSEHPDHGKWMPGIRQRGNGFPQYVLHGGPAADGTVVIRPDQPSYLDDPSWTENTSVVTFLLSDPEQSDGVTILAFPEIPGGRYAYRAATNTVEWDGPVGPSPDLRSVDFGGVGRTW